MVEALTNFMLGAHSFGVQKQKNAQLIAKAACVAEAVESRNASGGGKPAEGMVSGGGVSEAGYATTSDEEEQEGLSDWGEPPSPPPSHPPQVSLRNGPTGLFGKRIPRFWKDWTREGRHKS